MKRRVLALLLANVLCFGLAAGAGAAKVKLVFAMRNAVDTVAGQVWLKAMEEYQKENPNVEFEYFGDQNGTAYLEKITVMGASVGFPDVMHLQNLWMIDFASVNALDLVPKTLLGKLQNDLYPQSLKHLEYKGNVWGIPTELQVSAIMYNKQLMAQAGLAGVPKTWDSLIDQSKRLVTNSLNTNQKLSGLAVNAGGWGWSNNWHMLSAAYGGSYIDDKGIVQLDTAVNRSVMERIVEWFAPNGPATKDRGQFQTGKAYFGLAFPFWSAYIKTIFKEQWEDTFAATAMPAGPAGTYGFQYGWGLSVPASSKNKEEAWKFIDWLATKTRESGVTSIGEVQLAIGSLPANKRDLTSGAFAKESRYYNGFIGNFPYTVTEPNLPKGDARQTIIGNEIEAAIALKKSPQQALIDATASIKGLFEVKK